MDFMLGNLSVKRIEDELGITLKDSEREFLNNSRQQKASEIGHDKWHCFEGPNIVAGSLEMATKIRDLLAPYSDQMITRLFIGVDNNDERTDS